MSTDEHGVVPAVPEHSVAAPSAAGEPAPREPATASTEVGRVV